MNKLNWKQRLLIALISGITYGLMMIILNGGFSNENISKGIYGSLLFSIFFGLGFPFLLEKLAPKLSSKVKIPELNKNETIIFEEPANLFRNKFIAVGGKLFLTENRLIFNSHKYNFQNGAASITRENIVEIIERKSMGIVDNGLRITTKDNLKYDFVVNHRMELIEKLKDN
jgi:hypothetical protein